MTRAWDELRAALAEEPSELAFRAACAVLETWPDLDRDAALAFAEGQLAAWPDECRVAPWVWCAAAGQGHPLATWTLVRTLREVATRIGCHDLTLVRLAALPSSEITRLELNRYACLHNTDEAALLAAEPGRWPRLRHVLRLAPEGAGLAAFLACDLVPQLESLELFLPNRPTARSPAPGFTRPADNLRRLKLVVLRHATDFRPLLSAAHLPQLRELDLKSTFTTEPVPDAFRLAAAEPVFARLRAVCLDELPEEFVVAVLTRADVRPERVELRNRFYMEYLNPAQQNACRLSPDGVRAIAAGGALANVTHLRVENERVGDVVLDLVAAAGALRTLELVNVDLTDAGAARLAGLPQLATVTHLNLQQNPLTELGLAALVGSPYLGNLRRLDLGGGVNNPYYGGAGGGPQALGDRGAAALVASGLRSQLVSLSVRSAQLGPDGVAALCAGGSRLEVLDLSGNALGPDGARALAESSLPALRELDLTQSGLDDEACAHLGLGAFLRLRSLSAAYNSIGPHGAAHLAGARLSSLWRLNLHDNFVGDDGLVALAASPHLGRLVELDLEQDVWNYRSAQFGESAARAVATSTTFARLDAFHAGIVDEYHGGRYRHGFFAAGLATVRASTVLRPQLRLAPDALEQAGDAEEPVEYYYHHDTPRVVERHRCGSDFRGIPPLEEHMGPDEWRTTPDPGWMLEVLGEDADERKLRRFACECARRVLSIAPVESFRAVIDTVEKFLDGEASWAECEAQGELAEAHEIDNDESPVSSVRTSVTNVVRDHAHEGARYAAECAVNATVALAIRDAPGTVRSNTYLPEHHAQADLLRCLFAPPGEFDAGPWHTSSVLALAAGIDADRAFDRLPILADALMDAGCADDAVLAHCRDAVPHVRGCWVVDLLLGKT